MCDTFVALANHTKNKSILFGKNSDREPNEAQAIVHCPRIETKSKTLQCTYITIPQIATTYEVILSKPFQMWGAEMGVNEHGLVIGNEAVFTKVKFQKKNQGLTGMDLLRLALERCVDAKTALELITTLLYDYGQDACGGYQDEKFYYHNSFIIADKKEAWVLETAGREWVAQQVKDFRSISNGLTIESDFDFCSKHARSFAISNGWLKKKEALNFRKTYSDWLFTKFSHCQVRQKHSTNGGQAKSATFDLEDARVILSSHNKTDFEPAHASAASICMHATGPLNPSQTTGSMIVEIRDNAPIMVWLTGTSNPCMSVYKPFFFGSDVIAQYWTPPSAKVDDSVWWTAEILHRHIASNYPQGMQLIAKDQQAFQTRLFQQAKTLYSANATSQQWHEFSKKATTDYLNFLNNWVQATRELKSKSYPFYPLFNRFISQKNRSVGVNLK